MRLSDMAPWLHRFLEQREHACTSKHGIVSVANISPAEAVDAMCAFFSERPLEATRKPSPSDDALLFQITPAFDGRRPLVNITRQAYRGAGRSVQLSFDVPFAANDVDPSRGAYLTLWSWDVPSIEAFCSIAFGELDDRGALFGPRRGVLRIDRF